MLNGERTFLTDFSEIFGCQYLLNQAPLEKIPQSGICPVHTTVDWHLKY